MYQRFNQPSMKNSDDNFIKMVLAILFIGPLVIAIISAIIWGFLPKKKIKVHTHTHKNTITNKTTSDANKTTSDANKTTSDVIDDDEETDPEDLPKRASTKNRVNSRRSPKTRLCYKTCVMCKRRGYTDCSETCNKCASKLKINPEDIK